MCVDEHHAKIEFKGMEIQLHAFLNFALHRGEHSASTRVQVHTTKSVNPVF